MSSSYWGYWLIVFGVAIVGLSVTVNDLTTTTTETAYNIKEVNDRALLGAVDWAYYRDYNELRIVKEKYEELFLRSMGSIQGNDTFEVNFYGIYEAPPKVSVEVITKGGGDTITARNSAILETFAQENGRP